MLDGEMTGRARSDRDYYEVLGVHPEATEDELRRAYRQLALRWHPDRNPGSADAAERFKEISEAYAVLTNRGRRRQYDAARRAGTAGGFHASREDIFRDLFANPQASAVFEDLAREFERMGMRVDRHFFHQTLFGGRTVVSGGVVVVGPMSLRGLFRLAQAAVRATRPLPPEPREPARQPPSVLGAVGRLGRWLLGLSAPSPRALGEADVVVPLRLTPVEAARGGRKRVTLAPDGRAHDLLVRIPPGVRTGTRLRLRGKGRASGDGSRGDVYLAVEVG
jgi:DnaJ-class molecular chaperone